MLLDLPFARVLAPSVPLHGASGFRDLYAESGLSVTPSAARPTVVLDLAVASRFGRPLACFLPKPILLVVAGSTRFRLVAISGIGVRVPAFATPAVSLAYTPPIFG